MAFPAGQDAFLSSGTSSGPSLGASLTNVRKHNRMPRPCHPDRVAQRRERFLAKPRPDGGVMRRIKTGQGRRCFAANEPRSLQRKQRGDIGENEGSGTTLMAGRPPDKARRCPLNPSPGAGQASGPRKLAFDGRPLGRYEKTVCTLVFSNSPSSPNSTPKPDPLTPPNGALGWMAPCLLIQTVPHSICSARSRAL
jgi:hypothetical protein